LPRKQSPRLLLGIKGETAATDYLRQRGYAILERNFRCKIGEIDIIAFLDEFLVFIEVKTRKSTGTDINPLISLTKAKCSRLRRLGEYYRIQHRLLDKQPRFDAIGITYRDEEVFSLEHIENAF